MVPGTVFHSQPPENRRTEVHGLSQPTKRSSIANGDWKTSPTCIVPQLRHWCEGVFVGISRLRVVLCDRQGAADAWNDGSTSVETSDRLVEQRLRLVIGEHFGGAHERDRKSLALCPAGTGGHR